MKYFKGIIRQVELLMIICLMITAGITYITQLGVTDSSVKENMELIAGQIAMETIDSVKEYPTYHWLLRYWYEHADELDIEYDVDFGNGTETEDKVFLFYKHHPNLNIKYINIDEVKALPPEDQKLYAEITYSWVTTRVNQIKRSYMIDFLFCVITDCDEGKNPYSTQFFIFSGADEGAKRGTEYAEVYPLGKLVTVEENSSQQIAMKTAYDNAREAMFKGSQHVSISHIAYAGYYVDYYAYLDKIDDKAVLLGMTYDQSALNSNIHEQARSSTFLTVISQLLLLAIVMYAVYLSVLRPLEGILHNIRLYTKTKDSKTVNANIARILADKTSLAARHNEIGELSDNIVTLTNEIDDYVDRIENITAEKERIGVELLLASRIQASMLPSVFPPFPERHEFDLYASMTPAREVGGDFYDFFMVDEDHLGVVIADVSGKGVPAALFMMVSRLIIKNHAMSEKDPALALASANNQICAGEHEDMFVTAWLGILEISTGRLIAANAGHEYPAVKDPDGDFQLYKDRHGFVLGGMVNMRYKNYELQMKPGSKLFIYTDGVPEATNEQKELFGTERMITALQQHQNGRTEDILHGIDLAVYEFVGDAEQFDDLTMLCLEYRG